ncbi:MAG: hypothetical protein PW788_09810 [Micavibrio sp.]|nr:hypothetical protein [Micavibrio sp.]
MAYIITLPELEHLSEAELNHKYNAILNDLARRNMAADCSLATVTLENIRRAIQRKRALKPRGPRF